MNETTREQVESQRALWQQRWEAARSNQDVPKQLEAAKFLYHITWLLGDTGSAHQWVRLRKAQARATHRRAILAETLLFEAAMYSADSRVEHLESAFTALREARRIYAAERNNEGVAQTLIALGKVYCDHTDDDEQAADNFQEALRFIKPKINHEHWAQAHHGLARLAHRQRRFQDEAEHLIRALQAHSQMDPRPPEAVVLQSELATALIELGQFERALILFESTGDEIERLFDQFGGADEVFAKARAMVDDFKDNRHIEAIAPSLDGLEESWALFVNEVMPNLNA